MLQNAPRWSYLHTSSTASSYLQSYMYQGTSVVVKALGFWGNLQLLSNYSNYGSQHCCRFQGRFSASSIASRLNEWKLFQLRPLFFQVTYSGNYSCSVLKTDFASSFFHPMTRLRTFLNCFVSELRALKRKTRGKTPSVITIKRYLLLTSVCWGWLIQLKKEA